MLQQFQSDILQVKMLKQLSFFGPEVVILRPFYDSGNKEMDTDMQKKWMFSFSD